MLELAQGLTPRALSAIAELERRSVRADGGRLKLEWGVLRSRTGHRVEDILWWDGDRLLGFVGIYAFGPPAAELAGMVDPDARCRGIGTALLDAALPLCRDRGYGQVLLVVPGTSAAGRQFAIRHGGVLQHSEHALRLTGPPSDGPTSSDVTLRPAQPADVERLTEILVQAFGGPSVDVDGRLLATEPGTLVIAWRDTTVGTVRLTRDGARGGVYGFAIDPSWQGRGIGRDVLRRVCRQLRDEGATEVGLEVLVDNDRALQLYTSTGFVPSTTEDYYGIALA